MSRRDARRRPTPPPMGYHWEVGTPRLTGEIATYWLVENGFAINDQGFYTPKDRVPRSEAIPMPSWSVGVVKESRIHTETRRLLAARARAFEAQERVKRLQEQTRP